MKPSPRLLLPGLLAAACLAALLGLGRGAPPPAAAPAAPAVVYLAGGALPDDALLSLGALVAPHRDAVLLLDSPEATPQLRHFLAAYKPTRVVPVGTFPGGRAALEARLGVRCESPRAWPASRARLWDELAPGHRRVIACPPAPHGRLLRAAWLAGLLKVPLGVGDVKLGRGVTTITPEDAEGEVPPTAAAVVANPHDTGLSLLAPYLAAHRRARLLLTDADGTNLAALVAPHRRLDTLTLLADLKAIPMERRPNPIPEDKDEAIEMEPLTPADGQPFRFAVGRLFHADRALLALVLARAKLLARQPPGLPRRALVASNPGNSLGLLEAFSRNTHHELANAGYRVRGIYGKRLNARALRTAMVGPDIVLWEGHHNTLVKDWAFPSWDEPLPPALVFLQSCLALQEDKALPLLTRGAVAVVGSSTRIYSGSGGAFALAYVNALVHDGETLGGALRQAKNFMACYAALKQKRLGEQAERIGANRRASWSFTLWGDPALRLPPPAAPAAARPRVRHEVAGATIIVHMPEGNYPRVTSGKYHAEMPPGGRLAGLLRKVDDEAQALVPLVFVEVALPGAPSGCEPRLRARQPAGDWAFRWDAARRAGQLIAVPRPGARAMRFEVEWAPSWRQVSNLP